MVFENFLEHAPSWVVALLMIAICLVGAGVVIAIIIALFRAWMNRQVGRSAMQKDMNTQTEMLELTSEEAQVGILELTNKEAQDGYDALFEYVHGELCPECGGKGRKALFRCKRCERTGTLLRRVCLNIKVPPATQDGQILSYVLQDPETQFLLPPNYIVKAIVHKADVSLPPVEVPGAVSTGAAKILNKQNMTNEELNAFGAGLGKMFANFPEGKQTTITFTQIIRIRLTSQQLQNGVHKTLSVPLHDRCPLCGGSGHLKNKRCHMCKGLGKTRVMKSVVCQIPAGATGEYTQLLPHKGITLKTGRVCDLLIIAQMEK